MNEQRTNLLKAVQTIIETCKEQSGCRYCPLGDSDGNCRIFVEPKAPLNWEVNNEIWRVFK